MNVTTPQGYLPSDYFHIIDQDIASLTSELSERLILDTFKDLLNAIDRVERLIPSLTDLMHLCERFERFDMIQTLADQTPTSPLLDLLKGKIVQSAGRLIKLLKQFPDDTDALNKRINYLQTIATIECERNQNEMLVISFYSQILFLSGGQLSPSNREGFLLFYENFLRKYRHLYKQRLGLDLVSGHPQENFRQSLQLLQQLKSQGVSFALLSDLYSDARDILSKQSSTEEESIAIWDKITTEIFLLRSTPQPTLTGISPIEILWQELRTYRTQFLDAFASLNASLHTSSIGPSSSSSAPRSSSSTYPGHSQHSRIELVRQFQKERFQRFQTFFNERLMKSFFFVFAPSSQSGEESNVDIRAVGSIGREEPTLFSDIEFFILTRSRNHTYWQRARTLLDVTCRTFGEGAPTPSDGIESSDFICKGLYLDPFSDSLLEINSPEGLAAQQSRQDAEENILELTSLLKSSSLTTTDQTLFVKYQEQLVDFSYEKRALMLLKFRLSYYKKASHGAPLINLKSDYLELINHTLNDLSLYHRITASNTLDIIEALVHKGVFTQETGTIFQEIVAELYLMRIEVQAFYLRARSHSKHCGEAKSSEEILLRPAEHPSEAGKYLATPEDKLLLSQARTLVLIPLYAKLEEVLSDANALANMNEFNQLDIITEVFKLIVNLYETKQQHELSSLLQASTNSPPSFQLELYKRLSLSSTHESLREQYIDLLEGSIQQDVLQQLLQIPNPTGFRQKDRIERRKLRQNIEAITSSEQETPYRIESPLFSHTRYLKRAIASRVIDQQGNILSQYAHVSMNHVCSIQYNEISIHLKQAPETDKGSPFFPGKEQGVSRLMMRLFGHGTSFSELVYLSDTSKPKQTGYFVLISQTVFGQSLANKLDDRDELAQLDPKRLSEMFLSIPLILPGDHRPVNFMIEETMNEDRQSTKQLVCVDNDVAWIKPLQIKKSMGRARVTYNLYSPLFFIFPNCTLDPQAIEAFISLKPGLLLKAWFEELIQLNQDYHTFFRHHLPSVIFPFFAIDKGMGGQIFVQFCHLQSFLRKHQNRPIYAEEILKTLISFEEGHTAEIGQMLYEKYQTGKTLPGTASDKVKRVTGRDTRQSLSLSQSKAVMFNPLPCNPELLRPEQSMRELEAILSIYFGEITVSQGGNQISRIEKGFEEVIKSDGSPDLVTQEVLLESILTLTCDKLVLSHCTALTDDYLTQLIKKNGKTLTYLDLRDCQGITQKSVSRLSKYCPFLQNLYLSGCTNLTIFSENDNDMAKLLFLQELYIARCPSLLTIHLQSYALNTLKANDNPKLTTVELDAAIEPELDFSHCPLLKSDWQTYMQAKIVNNCQRWNIEGETIRQLYSNTPSFSTLDLTRKNIDDTTIGYAGIQALAVSLKINSSLTKLDLRKNKIGQTGARALADSLKLNSTLFTLNLGLNKIGPAGATALADSLKLNSSLTKLDLWKNKIGNNGAKALAVSLKLNSTLFTLNLRLNKIGPAGATALADSLKLNSSLSTLNLSGTILSGTQIGDTGATALADALKLNSSLTKLNLHDNQIGPIGATALADSLKLNSALSSLHLAWNQIGHTGAQALSDSLKLNSSLSTLNLSGTQIGDTRATALADALKLNSSLSELILRNNRIGHTGAQALSDSLRNNSSLSSLDLSFNQIGDTGAQALADCLKLNSILSSLHLSFNQIGDTGAAAITNALALNFSLIELFLELNTIGDALLHSIKALLERNRSLQLQAKRSIQTILANNNLTESHDTPPLYKLPQLHMMSSTPASSNQIIEELDYQDTQRASMSISYSSTTNPAEGFMFRYRNMSYQRRSITRVDGACALHVLLGSKVNNEYIWKNESIDSNQDEIIQIAAKTNFLTAVKAVLHQEHPLRDLLTQCMEERLVETDEFKLEILPFDEELSRLEQEICHGLPDFYWHHQEQLHPIFETCSTEFDKLKSDLESYRDVSASLMNCFNANYNTLKTVTFQDPRWEHLLAIKEVRIHLEKHRALRLQEFLMRNFELYSEMTQKNNCYLTMDELRLAAAVLLPAKTRVLVFFALDQEPHVIHPNGQGPTIAIEHSIAYHPHGQHFSRLECIRDDAPTSTT